MATAMFLIFHSVRRDTTGTSFVCKAPAPTRITLSLDVVAGTSASTPSFAGVMSLVDQKTGSRQGLANVVLYHLAVRRDVRELQCLDA